MSGTRKQNDFVSTIFKPNQKAQKKIKHRRHTKVSPSSYPHLLPRKQKGKKRGNKWKKNRDYVEPRRKINTNEDINIFSETHVLDPHTI